jgi:hypothetical protein
MNGLIQRGCANSYERTACVTYLHISSLTLEAGKYQDGK